VVAAEVQGLTLTAAFVVFWEIVAFDEAVTEEVEEVPVCKAKLEPC
jgi:hypothetical protein